MSTADDQRELGDKVLCRIDSVVEKGGRKRKGRTKPHPIPPRPLHSQPVPSRPFQPEPVYRLLSEKDDELLHCFPSADVLIPT